MSVQVKSFSNRRAHVADWELTQKPRVWRGQFRLLLILLLSLTTYLSLPATLYFTVQLILEPQGGWQTAAVGSLIAFVGSLIIGTILSAVTKCGLCHGTPFISKKCRKHVLANKLPGLSHRASSVIHLLFTGKFRCMYCSTPFRLGIKDESSSSSRRSR